MADPSETDPARSGSSLETRANELYWSSERSVNSIADDLGLSKGRLYEVVRPVRAGRTCPECRSDLVFENRTARDQDEAACPMCDGTQMPLPPSDRSSEGVAGRPHSDDDDDDQADDDSVGEPPTLVSSESGGVLGAVLVGVAIGLVLGRFFRR